MIVAGLDLSLTGAGVALIDTARPGSRVLIREGSKPVKRIPTPGRSPRTKKRDRGIVPVWGRAERLGALADRILAAIPEGADLAVIEGPSFQSRGGMAHERGGLWWLVASALHRDGIPLAEVAPRQRALYATGDGGAAKPSVVRDSVARYQLDTRDDNVIDALLLAAMGARAYGEPIDEPLHEPHTMALRAVAWPDLKGTPR